MSAESLPSLLQSINAVAAAGVQAGVDQERARSFRQIAALKLALQEALEFIDDYADVKDGVYGEQKPNRAMSLATSIKVALGELP